jgi:hypothetical protein
VTAVYFWDEFSSLWDHERPSPSVAGLLCDDSVGLAPATRWRQGDETADSEHNSNTLYTVYHDLLKGPIIMASSLKDALT